MLENTILEKLADKTLTAIVKDRKLLDKFEEETLPEHLKKRILSQDSCFELIKGDMEIHATNQFIQKLNVVELKAWTKNFEEHILTSKNINNANNATVMKKRLKEQIYESKKLKNYIKKADPTRKLLRATLLQLENDGLKEDEIKKIKEDLRKIEDRDELIKKLLSQLNLLALEYLLDQVSVKTLQMMIAESQLNIKTSSKQIMVRHLVDMKDYVPVPKKFTKPRPPKKEPQQKKKSDKENTFPKRIRPPKLTDIEIIFTSDDEEAFNPSDVEEKEISIGDMDAEKYDATLLD